MGLSPLRHAPATGPVLETERLRLRPTLREDFEAWAEFAADAEVMRFMGGPQPRPVAWRGFVSMAGSWALYGYGMFSVLDKASGRWLGRVGPWRPEGWPGNEVGWGLVRDAQGKGIAYEAAVATMDWAFESLGWDAVIHCVDRANLRSVALAERLGSVATGAAVLPPPSGVEIEVFAQTRAAWRARAAQRRGLPR